MSRIPVALELYSVRHDLTRDLLGTLKAVKAMGYEGVEFAGGFVHPAEVVKAALMETGLKVCGWHTPIHNVMPGTLEGTIAYNRIVGNDFVIVPGLPKEYTSSREGWKKAADVLNVVAQRLAKDDMYTGYHNHQIEFQPLDGEMPWDTFFGNTDPAVVMQVDTGNCKEGGADPSVYLKKYPGRALTVHLKPYSNKTHFDTMIGEDDTDWADIYKTCRTVGNTRWYIIEYESEKLYQPLDGVKRCIDAFNRQRAAGIVD